MTFKGKAYNVSAAGYHDHNWGRWAFNDPGWNWASVTRLQDNFSLIAFDTHEHEGNVSLGVICNETTIEFNDSYKREDGPGKDYQDGLEWTIQHRWRLR